MVDRGHSSGRHGQSGGGGGGAGHVSLARALSKLGWCSRAEARPLIEAGRVSVDGVTIRDPDHRLEMRHARIAIDGRTLRAATQVYLMLNKPRGWVTATVADAEHSTVFELLPDDLPRLIAVEPLDIDGEGLQLFTNDTRWADRILDPAAGLDRVYHVRTRQPPDDAAMSALLDGVDAGRGEILRAKQVRLLERRGGHWLEIVVAGTRARPIRRMLELVGVDLEQAVRVAVGPLQLGDLGAGMSRMLTRDEKDALTPGSGDVARKGEQSEQGRAPPASPARPGGPRRRRR